MLVIGLCGCTNESLREKEDQGPGTVQTEQAGGTVQGRIIEMNYGADQFFIRNRFRRETYFINRKTIVRKGGRKIQFTELTEDNKVTIVYSLINARKVASEITVH